MKKLIIIIVMLATATAFGQIIITPEEFLSFNPVYEKRLTQECFLVVYQNPDEKAEVKYVEAIFVFQNMQFYLIAYRYQAENQLYIFKLTEDGFKQVKPVVYKI